MSPIGFAALDLPEPVMRGIRDAGFVTATPIQEGALPLALRGRDVAGQSQTGTGKTAAFLIAAFTRCLTRPAPAKGGPTAPRVLIIAPTRELVVQIEADAHLLGAHTGLRTLAVYGGIDYNKQREALRESCDILVGTPGRLIDYLKQHVWSPSRVEVLVIDEADRMFVVYAMSADRKGTVARAPDRQAWSYGGPPLGPQLERVGRVRLIRERVTGGAGDGAFSWVADRGLALTGAGGEESLLLAVPETSEQSTFLPALGLYRALLDPAAPETPGATVKELLGYGDREESFQIEVMIEIL